MNPRSSQHDSTPMHPALDAALRQLGSATPDPQMNERLLHRLRTAVLAEAAPRFSVRWPRLAAAALGGSFACALIVTGSLAHSHTVAQQTAPPMLQLARPHNGVSTASAAHIAAHPVPAPPGKGRAHEQMPPGTHTRQDLALPKILSHR